MIPHLRERTPECSQTVHHWEAHSFAFGSQKSTTGRVRYFSRQEWGRPRSRMCLGLREIGHGRRQRWDTWLRAGVEGKVCRLTAAHLPGNQKIEMGKCFLRDTEGSQRKDTDFCGISNKKGGLLTGYPRVRLTLQSPHVCTLVAILMLPRWDRPNQSKGI